MIAGWFAEAPAFLAACAILVLPGLPAAILLRLRGVLLLGGAVIISLASVGAGSVLAPVVGMRWTLLPPLVVAAAITAVAAAVWLVSRRCPYSVRGGHTGWAWLGIAAATAGWVLILIVGISGAAHPSQLYDGVFHLNAVEFVLQKGDASPFHMTMAIPGAQTTFYPTLWHALVALIVPVSSGVVPATNVMTVAMIAVVWPAALATLTSVLFPAHRTAAAWAPLVGFGFAIFPLGFLNWGVLYPNLTGTLQIPLVLAFAVLVCRRGLTPVCRVSLALLTLAAMGGTALGHPSALFGAIALLVPFALCGGWELAKRRGRRTRLVLGMAGVVALAVLVLVWQLANVSTREWLPHSTLAQALGEVAFLSPVGRATGLLVGPLAFVGIWRVVRDRRWWILASHAVAVMLFLASTWLPLLWLRTSLVGVWYDDTTRVAALLGVLGLPLAAVGADTVWQWVRSRWIQGRKRLAAGAVLLVAVLALTHLPAVIDDVRFMRNVSFRFDQESQGLTADEAKLFTEASDLLGPDSLVIGDPLTGAALLYAYTGREVVFPHVTGRYGPDAALLARTLKSGTAAVCESIERLGVTHALDFGERELYENHYTTYDGLHELDESPILTEVMQVGSDATLYEVTGCH